MAAGRVLPGTKRSMSRYRLFQLMRLCRVYIPLPVLKITARLEWGS